MTGKGTDLGGNRVARAQASEPRIITAWVCDECGYWRQDKSTGVHQTNNLEDWRGKMVRHTLREARFVELRDAGAGSC